MIIVYINIKVIIHNYLASFPGSPTPEHKPMLRQVSLLMSRLERA